jgi:ATP-dependent RNA helicase SUPV3L1/SUV3
VSISAQDASQDLFSTDQTQEDAQASHDDTAQQDAMDSQILEASENVEELQHEEVSDSVPIPDAPVYSVSNEPTAVDQALSETPESPVADDVSSEAGMAEALSAEASLKPQLIDVWRPRRQQHHAHHHGAHKAKGAPREGQKRETKPRVFVITPRPVKPVSSEAGEGGSPAQHKSLSQEGTVSSFPQREGAGGHHRRDKGERADGARNKPRRDQKDFKKESKEGSRGGDGRGKRHDQRDERPRLSNTAFKGDASFDTARRDQEQGNIRLLASTEAQRKGKEPDPLSPFAKLLALKGEIGDKK